MAERNKHIETLRGIAIFLVVIGHVIGTTPEGGMKIDFPSPWRYLYLWIDYIQMPLFTGIAGWVYALKPATKGRFGPFVYKKAIRLLVPMATVGTLYFLVQYLIPGTNTKGDLSAIWKIYFFPYTIYWYLPSLFLIFILQFIADKYNLCQTPAKWLLLLIITWTISLLIKIHILSNIPNLLSFKGALDQLPYFIIGVGIYRFSNMLCGKRWKRVYTTLGIVGLVLLQYKWFYQLGYVSPIEWYTAVQPLCILATLILLLRQACCNRLFIWLGSYAYSIYLFHGFGTSGGRIILTKCGVHSELLIFIVATCIALFCPILVDKIVNKWKVMRMLFTGKI